MTLEFRRVTENAFVDEVRDERYCKGTNGYRRGRNYYAGYLVGQLVLLSIIIDGTSPSTLNDVLRKMSVEGAFVRPVGSEYHWTFNKNGKLELIIEKGLLIEFRKHSGAYKYLEGIKSIVRASLDHHGMSIEDWDNFNCQ